MIKQSSTAKAMLKTRGNSGKIMEAEWLSHSLCRGIYSWRPNTAGPQWERFSRSLPCISSLGNKSHIPRCVLSFRRGWHRDASSYPPSAWISTVSLSSSPFPVSEGRLAGRTKSYLIYALQRSASPIGFLHSTTKEEWDAAPNSWKHLITLD